MIREVAKAGEIWRRGIVRDLSNAVGETLQAANASQAPAQENSQ